MWGGFREQLPADVSCMPRSAMDAVDRLPQSRSSSHRESHKHGLNSERGSYGSRKASATPADLRWTNANSSPQEIIAHRRLICSLGRRFALRRWLAATAVHYTADRSELGKSVTSVVGVMSAAERTRRVGRKSPSSATVIPVKHEESLGWLDEGARGDRHGPWR